MPARASFGCPDRNRTTDAGSDHRRAAGAEPPRRPPQLCRGGQTVDAVSATMVLPSVAQDPQGLEDGLFELGEPGELDAEPDGTVVHRHSVPYLSVELDVHGRAGRGRLDGDMASDQLGTVGVRE